MLGILYVVATPIGNLKDITLRAIEVIKEVDLVLAEDTRVTAKLLSRYEIKKSVRRYDEYAMAGLYKDIKKSLENGEKIALLTDAGTPGIADPGSKLVGFLSRELPEAKIIPIPGPSALVSALSAAGINANQFTFLGYPPQKKGRQTFFKNLKSIEVRPVVLYESPHRIEKTFVGLMDNFGKDFNIMVFRELTKIHEEIFRGSLEECQEHFIGEHKKGEFVLIIP